MTCGFPVGTAGQCACDPVPVSYSGQAERSVHAEQLNGNGVSSGRYGRDEIRALVARAVDGGTDHVAAEDVVGRELEKFV
jgi:hypothetical protein